MYIILNYLSLKRAHAIDIHQKNCVFGLQKRKKSAIKLGDVPQNQYLCNVFHGIRFKVNKGWDSAEPLFLCP